MALCCKMYDPIHSIVFQESTESLVITDVCFDENIAESTITKIAKMKPYYFVMRDSSLASDNVADNFDQLFETYSKDTIRKII